MYPEQVEIIEVGLRDGLQNENKILSTEVKLEIIKGLLNCGLMRLEIGSFVNPKLIPQLADTDVLFETLPQDSNVSYSALVANKKGLDRALSCRVKHLAVFTAASESFCQKNINCSIAQSIQRFEELITLARRRYPVHIRGYISCAWDCPFEDFVDKEQVVSLLHQLKSIGCDEIVLADTTGKADPVKVEGLLNACLNFAEPIEIALHFHNNFNLALANILIALQLGISKFDSALAGLGGCPNAPHAGGNIATEDLIFMMESMDIRTGIDLTLLTTLGKKLTNLLDRPNMASQAYNV